MEIVVIACMSFKYVEITFKVLLSNNGYHILDASKKFLSHFKFSYDFQSAIIGHIV